MEVENRFLYYHVTNVKPPPEIDEDEDDLEQTEEREDEEDEYELLLEMLSGSDE